MFAKPQSEHEWFNSLLGNWTFTHECSMGPDSPPTITTGKVAARSLGGLWILLECEGSTPEDGNWTSLFTLGFDPARERYLGTFVASMMTHLWIYDGSLDDSGKQLILDVEGPAFDGNGMAKYQDIFEIVDENSWVLRSQMLGEDGQWHQFMVGRHQRA